MRSMEDGGQMDRKRARLIERQIDRKTDRLINRQTDRQTNRCW